MDSRTPLKDGDFVCLCPVVCNDPEFLDGGPCSRPQARTCDDEIVCEEVRVKLGLLDFVPPVP